MRADNADVRSRRTTFSDPEMINSEQMNVSEVFVSILSLLSFLLVLLPIQDWRNLMNIL